MSELAPLIQMRRQQLAERIRTIATAQEQRIQAFVAIESFLNAATREAAYGDSFAFFGRMQRAGEAIPPEFEGLDPQGTLKGADRRVVPFIRSQQFVAMVAAIEDFLSQVLTVALEAYPEKIGSESLLVSDLLAASTLEAAIARAIDRKLNELFYASPLKYREAIESYLSMPRTSLDNHWPSFVEMKARRDIGVHANWRKNDRYVAKVTEAKGTVDPASFLGVSAEYFSNAQSNARQLITVISEHCVSKFGKTGTPGTAT